MCNSVTKSVISVLILEVYKMLLTIESSELGLLDLTCSITKDRCEDDLSGSLVTGKLKAELVYFVFSKCHAFLDLDDRTLDLSESLVGKTYDSNVLNSVVLHEEVLDLYGVEVLTAADDNVLLTVNKVDESVLVLTSHITCKEPSVLKYFISCFFVIVVADHYAVALYTELADFTLLNDLALLVDDLAFPSVAGKTDGAYLMNVLYAQVYAAGTDGLGKTVVSIVLVLGEVLEPSLDKRLGNGLSTDMHKSPLIELVVGELNVSSVQCIEDILSPRYEKPYDSTVLVGYSLKDVLRLCALEKYCLGTCNEASHPVHLSSGVVKGRDAEETVVSSRGVVLLLDCCGMHEAPVLVKDSLGKSRCTGAEVDSAVIVIGDLHVGRSS